MDLDPVDGRQCLHSLQLDHDAIDDQQIKTTFTNSMTLIVNDDRDLSSIGQIS